MYIRCLSNSQSTVFISSCLINFNSRTNAGPAQFFANKNWTREAFLMEKTYVELLKNKTYHNLDEIGDIANNFEGGKYSMDKIINKLCEQHSFSLNRGMNLEDSLFAQGEDFASTWINGTVRVNVPTEFYPAGRELMFFHKPMENANAIRASGGTIQKMGRKHIAACILHGMSLPGCKCIPAVNA